MHYATKRPGCSEAGVARPAEPPGTGRTVGGAARAAARAGKDPGQRLRALMESRLGLPCLPLPSGRVALYLALVHWFEPGNRVLVSPVNDDVILFVLLAAGLRPVSAPVSPCDGNIDVDAVEDATWASLAG